MTTRKTRAGAPLRELDGIELPWAVSNNVSVSDDGKMARVAAGAGGRLGDDNWLYVSYFCLSYSQALTFILGGC